MEVRKGSMVNVNPTNTRPPNDTPEIRKYKKRFNSEILCAALWGENRNEELRLCFFIFYFLTVSIQCSLEVLPVTNVDMLNDQAMCLCDQV